VLRHRLVSEMGFGAAREGLGALGRARELWLESGWA
jgi:hypothetical protein